MKEKRTSKWKGRRGGRDNSTAGSDSITSAQGLRISRIATEDDPVFATETQLCQQSNIKSYQSMDQSDATMFRKDDQRKRSEESIEMQPTFQETASTAPTSANISDSPHSTSFSSCFGSMEDESSSNNNNEDDGSPKINSSSKGDQQKCRCNSYTSTHVYHSARTSILPEIKLFSDDEPVISGVGVGKAVRVRKVNLSYPEKILNTLTGSSSKEPVFVLNGISMTVPRGAIYGLLGPSGCGKTSLLRCIMGLIRPESGKVSLFGFKPGTPGSGVPGPGVGFMPQETALHTNLTIHEMLTYFGRLYFIPHTELNKRIDTLLAVLDLPPKDRLIGTLSGGQRRRVSFASALIHKPRLLILDEPTVGVDPVLREKIWNHLVQIAKEDKTTVIITTHYIEETRRADVVGFMRKGTLLQEGSPAEVMQAYDASGLEEVFYKLCTNQKRNSLRPVTRDTLKILRRQSIRSRKLRFHDHDLDPVEQKIPYQFPKETSSMSRTISQLHGLMSKYMIQISRQPESVVGQFVLPIICLVMFCVCIGGTPSQLAVAIINEEDPPFLSATLLKCLNPYILKQIDYTSFDEGIADVKAGKIWGVLRIRANFSEAIQDRIFFDADATNVTIEQSDVRLYADLSNKVLGITLDTVLVHTFEDFVKQALMQVDVNPSVGKFPIEIGKTVYGEFSNSDFFGVRDFAAPGFLIVITFSVAYALTCLSLLMERLDDMFERNYSAGVSTTQIILSILTVRFVFVAIGTIILLTMGIYLFDVPCRGSFWGVLLLLLLQSMAGMGMGLCVSSIVPDFFICAAASNGILIFIFVISGVLWSLETLPYYIRWFSYIQPTTLPAESMRSMLTRGLGVLHPSVWPGFVVSMLWIALLLITAGRIFKYQK